MRIVFMGTPDFAVASLKALHEDRHEIVGVVTATDKPAGRGKKIQESVVKQYAVANGLNVLQPPNLKSPEFVEELKSLKAELFVVVAFRMLPEVVWSIPPKGTINLHGSLLPDYRGAAPINWAIINGEQVTGVTTFFIEKDIDTGKIIAQSKVPIEQDTTAGELHDTLMELGARLVVETVASIANDTLTLQEQPERTDRHAPKLFPADGEIDWSRSALEVHNKIRGLSPYPGTWSMYEGRKIKLLASTLSGTRPEAKPASPGTLLVWEKRLFAAAADGWVELLQLKPEGKGAMDARAFINGYQPHNLQLA